MSETTQAGQAITDAATQVQAPTSTPVAVESATPPPSVPDTPNTAAQPAAVPPQPSVPEAYSFTVPEGMNLSEATVGKFSDVAKDLKLSQDAAQRILGDMAGAIQAQQSESLKAFYADIGGMPDTWEAQVRADKDIGGDKLKDNLAAAARFRDAYGSPELKSLLDKTGLGNHPELVRVFIRAGKAISPDTFVSGNGSGASSPGRTLAERLYGSSTPS